MSSNHTVSDELEQRISVQLKPGDRVTLYKSVDKDSGGFAGRILFEDTVERHNPKTGLLSFEDGDVGRAEFFDRLDQSVAIQII